MHGYTAPPTTPPPPPPPCGGVLTGASGTFQTPNWPETYPVNINCEWKIRLPDLSKLVEIRCEEQPFGIAGAYPDCSKDHLKFYDGHSTQDDSFGPYCHFTPPNTLTMSSNIAMAVFSAGPSHNPSRRGFKCSFQSAQRPTTVPPTTLPPTLPPAPLCGGMLNSASGSFQTLNWPETYPVDVDCEWKIILPDSSKVVEIRCEEEPFSIAGTYPDCTKDHLKLYDGHSTQDDSFGPYCHYTPPNTLTMSSNLAMAVFHAGPSHNPSRRGFKCSFQSAQRPTTVPPTTLPPTLPPTTLPPAPLCGGTLNSASGSFQTLNWPETYPVDVDCEWKIILPDSSKVVEVRCEEQPFGIAGAYPDCIKDHLKFYDGHSTQDDSFGPYCHFTPPNTLKMSSNLAMAVFHAGPSHNPSRQGFKCTFQSLDGPEQPTKPSTQSPPPSTKAPPPSTTTPPPTTRTLPPTTTTLPSTTTALPPTTRTLPPTTTLSPPLPPGECALHTLPQNLEGNVEILAIVLIFISMHQLSWGSPLLSNYYCYYK